MFQTVVLHSKLVLSHTHTHTHKQDATPSSDHEIGAPVLVNASTIPANTQTANRQKAQQWDLDNLPAEIIAIFKGALFWRGDAKGGGREDWGEFIVFFSFFLISFSSFAAAGIKKTDLRDPRTAEFAFKFVQAHLDQMEKEAVASSGDGPASPRRDSPPTQTLRATNSARPAPPPGRPTNAYVNCIQCGSPVTAGSLCGNCHIAAPRPTQPRVLATQSPALTRNSSGNVVRATTTAPRPPARVASVGDAEDAAGAGAAHPPSSEGPTVHRAVARTRPEAAPRRNSAQPRPVSVDGYNLETRGGGGPGGPGPVKLLSPRDRIAAESGGTIGSPMINRSRPKPPTRPESQGPVQPPPRAPFSSPVTQPRVKPAPPGHAAPAPLPRQHTTPVGGKVPLPAPRGGNLHASGRQPLAESEDEPPPPPPPDDDDENDGIIIADGNGYEEDLTTSAPAQLYPDPSRLPPPNPFSLPPPPVLPSDVAAKATAVPPPPTAPAAPVAPPPPDPSMATVRRSPQRLDSSGSIGGGDVEEDVSGSNDSGTADLASAIRNTKLKPVEHTRKRLSYAATDGLASALAAALGKMRPAIKGDEEPDTGDNDDDW